MLRSILGNRLLVIVYCEALSVAAPEAEPGERLPPKNKFFRAVRMRIDSLKIF